MHTTITAGTEEYMCTYFLLGGNLLLISHMFWTGIIKSITEDIYITQYKYSPLCTQYLYACFISIKNVFFLITITYLSARNFNQLFVELISISLA